MTKIVGLLIDASLLPEVRSSFDPSLVWMMFIIFKMTYIIQVVNVEFQERVMRRSREEKDDSHARIVSSASRLLRERGISGTSVSDVMQDAGLTHGGFYRHFENKDALSRAALEAAFDEILALFDQAEGRQRADTFEAFYLSKRHVDHAGRGCPAAALASEVARHSNDALKHSFGAGIRRMITALAEDSDAPASDRRAAAARRLAMMLGAVVIARATDAATAKLVLSACRD